MTDEEIYAIWNATPHSIDRLRMIADFGRTLYRMGQEEMRERAREAVHCRECASAVDALEVDPEITIETKSIKKGIPLKIDQEDGA